MSFWGFWGFLAVATEDENSPLFSAAVAALHHGVGFFDRFGQALHSQNLSMDWTPPDTRFAVTIEEIVEHAVGWIFDDEEFDAISVLQDEVANAMDDLADAKVDKAGSAKLKQLSERIKTLKSTLYTANQIAIALHHELEALRRGDESELKIFSDDKDAHYPRFTKYSVYSWLHSNFDITIAEWAPPDAANKTNNSSKNEKELRSHAARNYELIIEGLARLHFQGEVPSVLIRGDSINNSELANRILAAVKPDFKGTKLPTKSLIEKRLAAAGLGRIKVFRRSAE